MSDKICGSCANWRCDEPLHLKGHCIIDRGERPHGAICNTCIKYVRRHETCNKKK